MSVELRMMRSIKLLAFVAFSASCLVLWRLKFSNNGSQLLREIFPTQHLNGSTDGIYELIKRLMPLHTEWFELQLVDDCANITGFDKYMLSSTSSGKIRVSGTSLAALLYGIRRYLNEFAHVDFHWYTGSRLHLAPVPLPSLPESIYGASTVKWRYYFNTVTFSYTAAFWSWDEWELQLDWMALHGINLSLALVGSEKILIEVFREIGLTDDEIWAFLSGPASQSWNRLGNIHGSWNGEIPRSWIEGQFVLSKQILARMVELGIVPILPAFTGFVPNALPRAQAGAGLSHGSQWSDFPEEYTNTSFLEPMDPLFQRVQKLFIGKQRKAYNDVSHMYILDQYNENLPFSNDPDYLRNTSRSTLQSLKAADPMATWIMPAWLFSDAKFWTAGIIESWFAGIEVDSDLVVLDLSAESTPLWQQTDSFHGKSWIWCQLHNYGGNMGLGGQIMNITMNATKAVTSSRSLLGFGLAMEGQEQENQIVYDLLLDQAWSETPIDTQRYFHDWVTSRYSGTAVIPKGIYDAWEAMRATVYNNTNLTSSAVSKSIFGLEPSLVGLADRPGRHPTTIHYPPNILVRAWRLFFEASIEDMDLWKHPAYLHDLVDITRQVIANEFASSYKTLISIYTANPADQSAVSSAGEKLLALLDILDKVLDTNENFRLVTWINLSRALGGSNESAADLYEREARMQITLWGPSGEISDYASKDWGGLIFTYYMPRWKLFTQYLLTVPFELYNATELHQDMRAFELKWQNEGGTVQTLSSHISDLRTILTQAQRDWPLLFSHE